jgi:hypothetical protein
MEYGNILQQKDNAVTRRRSDTNILVCEDNNYRRLTQRLIWVVAASVALSATATTATAQSRFNVGIGAAIPIGSSADRVNPGYSMIASFTTRPHFMTRNRLRFEFGSTSLPERAIPDSQRDILSGTVNLIIIDETRPTPIGYSIIGLGTYQKSGSVQRHSDPGFNVGAGIRFTMGFFGTFVEARLHYINDADKTKYFPMTFGLTF